MIREIKENRKEEYKQKLEDLEKGWIEIAAVKNIVIEIKNSVDRLNIK